MEESVTESNQPSQPPTGLDLVSLFATLEGITLALSVFAQDEGPQPSGVSVFAVLLLLGALVFLAAALNAMAAAWTEAGLDVRRDVFYGRADNPPHGLRATTYAALVFGTWGLWNTGIIQVILLATNSIE